MTPKLDLIIIDTHSTLSIALADTSSYPTGWINTNPTIQITPPGYELVTLPFTPTSMQVYKAINLGIVCNSCGDIELPDGIWKFKYSVYPANVNYVEKSFVRIDRLQEKLDELYLNLDISECDEKIKREDKEVLSIIQDYIEGAVSAGNKCVDKLFTVYYQKATQMINQFINKKSCVTR